LSLFEKKLNLLNGWAEIKEYFAPQSAQGYSNANKLLFVTIGSGSACGAGDDAKPKTSACGAGYDNHLKTLFCFTISSLIVKNKLI
jgi:hypothetical protein